MFKSFASLALVSSALLALAGCSGTSNQTASQPTITAVALSPVSIPLAPGGTQSLTVTATQSNGASVPVTSGVTFTSSNTNVATVSSTGVVTAGEVAGTSSITATVSTDLNQALTTAPSTVTVSVVLSSIAVTPATKNLVVGATQQLTVTGTYDNNTTKTLTSGETFASSASAVATVSASGLVTAGTTPGTATITVTDTASGFTGSATITVSAAMPTLTSITVTPATTTLAQGATQQLTVTGNFSNNTTENLTSVATFASSSAAVATVSSTGLVTAGTTPGTATITATDAAANLTGTASVTVSPAVAVPPTLVSIALSPLTASVAPGSSQQLIVTGTYNNNTTKQLAASGESFTSMSPGVVSVSASGLATVAAGATAGATATIVAKDTASGISTTGAGSTVITVAGSTTSSAVLSTGFNSNQTTTTSTSATGKWNAYFGSSNTGVAGGSGGGYADKNTSPSYEYVYINDTLANLGSYTYQGIGINPATGQTITPSSYNSLQFTLAVNAEWFTAGANFVVLIAGNVPGVSNATCNPSAAAVVTATASGNTVYTVPLTAFTYIAQNCGVGSVTPAQILAASLTEVDFQADGLNAAITASGLKSNVNTTVPAAGSSPATYPTTINVVGGVSFLPAASTPSPLVSIAVTPATQNLAVGATQQLTVTGTYANNTTQVLTSGETFASSAPAVASVTSTGLVTAGTTAGTATITVTDTASGFMSTATITTSAVMPTLTSITVTPATTTLSQGATQQLTVTGNYSNSTTQNLTGDVTFQSSNTAVATVTVAGLVTAGTTAGTVTITATDTAANVSGTASFTVSPSVVVPPALVSIALSPVTASLAPGAAQQLTVTGTYSSGPTQTLPASGETFTSLSTGVATVNASGLVTVAAGATPGQTATITAKDNASGISTTGSTSTTITVVASSAGAGNVYSNGALDTGVTFAPFGGSTNSPLPAPDPSTPYTDNTPALKVVVTGTSGAYSGGAFVAATPRDLRSFNALTFWAKASQAKNGLKVQLGNDAGAGANVNYQVESIGISLTTNWQQYVIPLPDPTQANGIDGLFSFAEAADGYTVWFANVQYVNVPSNVYGSGATAGDGFSAATNPLSIALGATSALNPATNSIIWTLGTGQLNGSAVVPLPSGGNLDNVAWRWFALTSSNADSTVNSDGVITGAAAGTSVITGSLAGTAIPGQVNVTVTAPLATPTTNAATPAVAAGNVVALYDSSGAYTPSPIDNLNENWCGQGAAETSFTVPGGNPVLQYNLPGCTGIGFGDGGTPAHRINATADGLTNFHVDLWSPNPVPVQLRLVDGLAGAGNYTPPTIPANTWTSIDVPLSSFGLSGETELQQLGLINTGATVLYIDNLYFYKTSAPMAPTSYASTPTLPSSQVIALFNSSATYADHPVDTFLSSWSSPSTLVNPYAITGGGGVLDYTLNAFAGLVFGDGEYNGTVNQVDATSMTTLHVDLWVPNASDLQIELVNNAASGTKSIGTVDLGTIAAGTWVSKEIPLASFAVAGNGQTGLLAQNALQQLLIIAPSSGTVFFIDNLYFHD